MEKKKTKQIKKPVYLISVTTEVMNKDTTVDSRIFKI